MRLKSFRVSVKVSEACDGTAISSVLVGPNLTDFVHYVVS
jgi:hypothetical protein